MTKPNNIFINDTFILESLIIDGSLDLCNLNLQQIPKIDKILSKKVKYLFLSNNSIETLDGLHMYPNLETLDVSNNKLYGTVIIEHSNKLEEIDCSYNSIDVLNYENQTQLTRLNCRNNNLKHLEPSNNIIILDCRENKLNCIYNFPKLQKLLCSENMIESIKKCPNVIEIVAHTNKLTKIPTCQYLEYIDLLDNNITTLNYISNLKEIICTYTDDIDIDPQYKITDYAISHKKNNSSIIIIFNK
jgi:Leucine-rich repeat (LRR) protein